MRVEESVGDSEPGVLRVTRGARSPVTPGNENGRLRVRALLPVIAHLLQSNGLTGFRGLGTGIALSTLAMLHLKSTRRNRGFSLIELLVVMGLICRDGARRDPVVSEDLAAQRVEERGAGGPDHAARGQGQGGQPQPARQRAHHVSRAAGPVPDARAQSAGADAHARSDQPDAAVAGRRGSTRLRRQPAASSRSAATAASSTRRSSRRPASSTSWRARSAPSRRTGSRSRPTRAAASRS